MCLAILAAALAPSRAERVPMSSEELKSRATHIIVGQVLGVYGKTSEARGFQDTHYVAEVRVEKAERGEGLRGELCMCATGRSGGKGPQPLDTWLSQSPEQGRGCESICAMLMDLGR